MAGDRTLLLLVEEAAEAALAGSSAIASPVRWPPYPAGSTATGPCPGNCGVAAPK
jgi:hypothetical protein